MVSTKIYNIADYRNDMAVAVVIPARLASTRFPNKMLQEVMPGVTLIEQVYNQVCSIHDPNHVYVATDSQAIAALFDESQVVMTSEKCQNGTERVAEAADTLKQYQHFVNVQGDMIDTPLSAVADIISFLQNHDEDVVTVCKEMGNEDRNNPSTVKCVNNGMTAHWFCRAPLEYGDWHLGIYGYSRGALMDYIDKLKKYPEEDFESLEQLRWIQNHYNINIVWTDEHASEINTPEDLAKWQQQLTLPS